MDDRIKKAFESIEPEAGAEERMLANIKKKAEEQAKNESTAKSSGSVKVLRWALPIAACFMIALIGVKAIMNNSGSNDDPIVGPVPDVTEGVQMSSPFEEVASADVLYNELGIFIDAPNGSNDVCYSIADGNMADISFNYDGHEYCLRASRISGDLSGICGEVISERAVDAEWNAVLTEVSDGSDIWLKLTWTDGEVNYCLSNTDGAGEDAILGIYELI